MTRVQAGIGETDMRCDWFGREEFITRDHTHPAGLRLADKLSHVCAVR